MKGDLSPFKRAQARDKSEFPALVILNIQCYNILKPTTETEAMSV